MAKRCCRIYDFLIIDATAPFMIRGDLWSVSSAFRKSLEMLLYNLSNIILTIYIIQNII